MTTRTRKVVIAIDSTGNTFAEIHRETQVGARWYPDDPVPLEIAGDEATAWKAEFHAAQQAENTALKAAITTLKSDHEAAVTALNTGHGATVDALHAQIATLTADLATRTAERDAAVAQIPPTPSPREVTPSEVVTRIMNAAPQAIKKIWTSDADIAAVALATLFTWPGLINLDSERLHQMLGGLIQAQLLTSDEVETILA